MSRLVETYGDQVKVYNNFLFSLSAIMSGKFEAQFPLQHQQKDLRLAINMADSIDQPLHVGAAANEVYI